MDRLSDLATRLARSVLDLALPPACPVTDGPVTRAGALAPQAWGALTFVTDPACVRCGAPFAYDPGAGTECGTCLSAPPAFDAARAPLVYDAASKPLVLALKHGGRRDALSVCAGWMRTSSSSFLPQADRLIPVPLHAQRLRARRFNQSLLLARALSHQSGVPTDPDTLMRRRATETQAGRTPAGRARNVSGAFAVRPGRAAALKGLRVVLVDDVFTTGATLSACARPLKRAGAAWVGAICLARVVRGALDPILE